MQEKIGVKMVWNGIAYNKYDNLYNAIHDYVESNLHTQIIMRAMTYNNYLSTNPSGQKLIRLKATHDICKWIIKHDVKVIPNFMCKKLDYPIYDEGELCDWSKIFTLKEVKK